jgi:hypothetical protein
MKAPDFLALILCFLSIGGGYYVNTLSKQVARFFGISMMAIGIAGLLFWFIYLRDIVELPSTAAKCSNSVGGNNAGPMVNNCTN